MNKVRWGLLSTARINRRVIPSIQRSNRSELIAVASRNHKKAQKYAQDWEIPLAFGSYQEMLDSGKIDAVYISLPNHLHAEWTIRALNSGIHVLCEKPMALTLKEVDEMIKTSQQTKRILSEAFMYRHHPQTKIAGKFIQDGNLGEISHAWGSFSFMLTDRKDIRLVREWGGGSLWDIGVYPVSLAQFLLGSPPQSVMGNCWEGDTDVDETFAGQLCYPGERFAQISCSFRTQFHTHFEIIGTHGRLIMNRPFIGMEDDRRLTFQPNEGAPFELPVPEEPLYLGEIEDLNSAILDGKPAYLTLDETRNHIRTVLALYQSARTKKSVFINQID